MTQRALVGLIVWQCGVSALGEASRTLQFSPLSFDVSFQEIFATWCSGGTLVLIDDHVRRDPIALLEFLRSQKIERLFLPFVALQQLAEAAAENEVLPSALREVYTAGEQLIITPEILSLFERTTGCTLHNHYGPSESHVVTAFTLPPQRHLWEMRPSIGDSVGGTNAFKRIRGWEQTAADLGAVALEHNATALMFDEREVWHGVDYYGRTMNLPPVRAWRRGDHPRSHAEEAGAMLPGEDRRVLVASLVPEFRPMIRADFDAIEPVSTLTVPLGPKKTRVLKLYLASGYHPLPRTAEHEAKFRGQRED